MVAGRRMHGQERWLVDREEVRVLVDDGHVRGHGILVPGRSPEEDVLFRLDTVVRTEALAPDVERAVADDELRPRPARAAELSLKEDVEPLPGELGRDPEDAQHGAFRHAFRAREAIDVRVRDPKPAHRSSLTTRRLQNRVI